MSEREAEGEGVEAAEEDKRVAHFEGQLAHWLAGWATGHCCCCLLLELVGKVNLKEGGLLVVLSHCDQHPARCIQRQRESSPVAQEVAGVGLLDLELVQHEAEGLTM